MHETVARIDSFSLHSAGVNHHSVDPFGSCPDVGVVADFWGFGSAPAGRFDEWR